MYQGTIVCVPISTVEAYYLNDGSVSHDQINEMNGSGHARVMGWFQGLSEFELHSVQIQRVCILISEPISL